MTIVCAWCKKKICEKEPLEDDSVSHSICEICYGNEKKKTFRQEKSDKFTRQNRLLFNFRW
jgi:hypothetical protein